jgi:hypothetical protein
MRAKWAVNRVRIWREKCLNTVVSKPEGKELLKGVGVDRMIILI